jgi:hypothetical protein
MGTILHQERRLGAGNGIRERRHATNDACLPIPAVLTQTDGAPDVERSNPDPVARRQQPDTRTPSITTQAIA